MSWEMENVKILKDIRELLTSIESGLKLLLLAEKEREKE